MRVLQAGAILQQILLSTYQISAQSRFRFQQLQLQELWSKIFVREQFVDQAPVSRVTLIDLHKPVYHADRIFFVDLSGPDANWK